MKKLYNLLVFLTFLVVFIASLGIWIQRKFGTISYEQIIFHIKSPLDGIPVSILFNWAKNCILPLAIAIFLYFLLKRYKKIRQFYIVFLLLLSLCLSQSYWHFDKLYQEAKNSNQYSNFYEKHYIYPKKDNIIFPKDKRNLILITLESMESTYSNQEVFNPILTPNLTQITNHNFTFKNKQEGGGVSQLPNTGWTIAGIVSYHCGLPLSLPIHGNNVGKRNEYFLGGATCLGNILDKASYKQIFLIPHQKEFSGLNTFLQNHKIEVKGLGYFKQNGLPKDYEGFWGLKDSLSFDSAKKILLKLQEESSPFALYILSIDTHAQEGYTDPKKCGDIITTYQDQPYKNAILCTDRIVGEFIQWAKKQDFYKNTTIVILGDHLSMAQGFFPKNIKRGIYNAFINPHFFHPLDKSRLTNRKFSHFDLFPTILDSLGVQIKGNQLGLGIDLMSNQNTLFENRVFDINNLTKKSKIYEEFLYKKKSDY